MTAREVIDADVQAQVFTLDLGETITHLDFVVPRVTTWWVDRRRRIAPELIAIAALMGEDKRSRPLTEALTKSDLDEVKRLIKKQLTDDAKLNEKDQLTFVRNVLTSFVKSLYTKRATWGSDLSGTKSA